MITKDKTWFIKVFQKEMAADYKVAENRYSLLKKNANYLYPNIHFFEDKKTWIVKQQFIKKKIILFLQKYN